MNATYDDVMWYIKYENIAYLIGGDTFPDNTFPDKNSIGLG